MIHDEVASRSKFREEKRIDANEARMFALRTLKE